MSDRNRLYKRGVARANMAGVMLLVITLCQYAVPAAFFGVLKACGVDTSAAFWGLPSAPYLCLYLLMYVLMIGLPLWICATYLRQKDTSSAVSIVLSRDRFTCLVLFGVALCMLANIVTSFLSDLLYDIGVSKPVAPAMGDGTLLTLLFDLLVFALVPAVMEELLMRGIVLETLRPLGNNTAVILSAILFGLLHGNLAQAPYACLMGLVLGGLYVYTGALRPVIAVHALANATAVIMSFLRLYSDSATASLWGLVMLIVILMSGGVASIWLWRHPLNCPKKPMVHARRALLNAPFLWVAVAILLALLIVRSI